MKVRAKCKCGAEFETSGIFDVAAEDYRIWAGVHATMCLGVSSWTTGGGGGITITPQNGEVARSATTEAQEDDTDWGALGEAFGEALKAKEDVAKGTDHDS